MASRVLKKSEIPIVAGGYTKACYDSVKKVKDNPSPFLDVLFAIVLTPFGLIGKAVGQQMTLATICDGGNNLRDAEYDYCLTYPNNCIKEK